jgi:hypothetical protein
MPTNESSSSHTRRRETQASVGRNPARRLPAVVLPVVIAGAASGIAREITSWLLTHLGL